MMIPDYFNSPFPADDPMEDREPLREHQFFFPSYDHSTSASSYSVFFPDQSEPCRFQMHQDDHQPQQVEDANYEAQYAGSQPSKGLKITLWKNSEKTDDQKNPVKWMSSKMRMMQKMKSKCAEKEDNNYQKKQAAPNSPHESTDHFSSSNSSSNNSTTPFRVCSDCNTTKTPLWRSGPKGPKSLCNACGIRQRKARRALAASTAAAAAAVMDEPVPQSEAKSTTTAAVLKIKVPSKEKMKSNGVQTSTTPFKKRCTKLMCSSASSEGPSSHAQKKSNVFEDFLINLSKNLAVHRVFPQDEKEAAILLMAISSGLVHG